MLALLACVSVSPGMPVWMIHRVAKTSILPALLQMALSWRSGSSSLSALSHWYTVLSVHETKTTTKLGNNTWLERVWSEHLLLRLVAARTTILLIQNPKSPLLSQVPVTTVLFHLQLNLHSGEKSIN